MLGWIGLGVLGFGVGCLAYGVFVERAWYRLVRFRLDVLPPDLPERIDLLHLSDLHFVTGDEKKRRFLAALPRSDITVVTGDLLGEPEAVESVTIALGPVRGRRASYFVLGSNDYFKPRPLNYLRYFRKARTQRWWVRGRAGELVEQLEADGWAHLKNVRLDVPLNGSTVEVVGMDDPHLHRHDLRVAPRRAPERFGLAVVHSPDPAPELAALGYDLIVAGHTHGGQVRLPFVGALISNCTVPPRMARGLFRLGRSFLNVSAGLGTSKYAPFRFLCRPEATLLELRRAPGIEASSSNLN